MTALAPASGLVPGGAAQLAPSTFDWKRPCPAPYGTAGDPNTRSFVSHQPLSVPLSPSLPVGVFSTRAWLALLSRIL